MYPVWRGPDLLETELGPHLAVSPTRKMQGACETSLA
jgi:hypothetical protein